MKNVYLKLWYGFFAVLFFSFRVAAQEIDYQEYKPLLLKNATRLGITYNDVNTSVITYAYTDAVSGITYVYLQQAYQQIKVYNTIVTAAFRNSSLLYASGTFINNLAAKAGTSLPAKSHTEAVVVAARHLQLSKPAALPDVADYFSTEKKYVVAAAGIAKRNIDVTLYWTPSANKQQVTLTWNVNIDVLGSANWWNVQVNAQTGDFVEKANLTVNEDFQENIDKAADAWPVNHIRLMPQPVQQQKKSGFKNQASIPPLFLQAPSPNVTGVAYQVIPFPVESPAHGSFATVNDPWLRAGAGNNAVTHGWHFDGTNNFTITRGNNVFAFLDRRTTDIPDGAVNWPDTSATPAPSLSFIHTINTAEQPFKNIENKKAALDNLFYWSNLMHDVSYQYGFTEAAGNFQTDNLGRGGLGNDYVRANAQDSSGYNNANFATPADGSSPRMQLYTFTASPHFSIDSPAAIAADYPAIESNFESPNKLAFVGPVTGQVVVYNDDATGSVHTACNAPANNAAALNGKIALIDASGCDYILKVKNAQAAGAIAALLYSGNLFAMTGRDVSITIPALSITANVANSIIAQLNASPPVPVTATMASGVYRDGDLDNGVICHEYGHGITTRLTGGVTSPLCLTNAEQAGEGWSDYFGLMMTTNWATASVSDGSNPRPIATYALSQPANGGGVRHYPYTTNMAINPLTYTNMATNTEIHATGEIWCSAIWDMTWNIIQQVGSLTPDLYNSAGTGGNVIAMNLVITGLKLQPCAPGFIDSRNAILMADSILYNYAHKCAIWNAFARRGMGYSALQGLSSSATDQTPAFDVPADVRVTKPLPLIVSANAQINITHTASCQCAAVGGYVLRDTIPTGFTYVSSTPSGTLSGNVLSFPPAGFAALESKNFSLVLQSPGAGCTIDSVVNDNRETSTVGGLVSTGTPGWNTTNIKSHTPASSWFVANLPMDGSSSLTSGSFAVATTKNLSILSFWHYYNIENNYDGGVVEYSTNGSTWNDAGPLFIRNGYTTKMDPRTVLNGRSAFSGTNVNFTPSLVDLSSFGTLPVAFRFRMESDDGLGADGWYVDDIVHANGCGGLLKTGIYNNAGTRQDAVITPVFVKPPVILPVTLLWFYASQVGGQVALDWKTVSEINVKDFTIEWSKNGTDWTTITSVIAANRSSNNYNTIHTMPVAGNNYYRIRMNDVDGRFTYSPVRVINITEKGSQLLVLVPNPVSADATLYLSKDLKARSIKMYDAAGSLVRQINVGAGVQQLRISTANLAAGVYTLEATGGERQVVRMLVQH